MKISTVKFTPISKTSSRLVVESDSDAHGEWIVPTSLTPAISTLADACLMGEDGRATTAHWNEMASRTQNGSEQRRAAAALDIALWDMKAMHHGEPLWRTLGGDGRQANAHLSCKSANLSADEIFNRFSEQTKRFGFREGKLRLPLDDVRNEERLSALIGALDNTEQPPALYLAADNALSVKDALRSIQRLEKVFDITVVEAPCAMWDVRGSRRLGDSIKAAIMNDLSISGREGFLPHFYARSLNILQLDIQCDGITGVLELTDSAFGYELPVIIADAPGNIGAHLAGALPYFMSVEICEPADFDGYGTSIEMHNGWAKPGEAPGLGLTWRGAQTRKTGVSS